MDILIGVGNLLFLLICHIAQGKRCMYPGHGLHTKTNMTTQAVLYDTIVNYKCDSGFEMFGSNSRKCQLDGKWTGEEPVCTVNVARYGIVVAVSPYVDTREGPEAWSNIIDAFYKTCSVASNTDMVSSSWSIDLLFEYEISFIKVAFGEPIRDIMFDIYEGNITGNKILLPVFEDGFKNVHSVFVDFEYDDAKEMTEYLLKFKRPVTTRFITIQIPTQYQLRSRITLCEVSVYSVTAASPEQCELAWIRDAQISVLGSSCYSFHHSEHKRWKDAKSKCQHFNNGNLISTVNDASQEFLRRTLKRFYTPVTVNDVFWVGGHKRTEFEADGITPLHKWRNETTDKYFVRNKHDSGGVSDALDSCLTISGPLGWKWITKNCYSHFPWICEYPLPHCGHPDQQERTIMDLSLGTEGFQIAQYSCPEGFAIEGIVNCGQPEAIFNGSVKLVQGTTTYGSAAEYSCLVDGLHLIGPNTRVCQREGKWGGDVPFCSDVLPDPEGQKAILNLEIVLAVALVCLGMVIMITIITLCLVFFKKRPRKASVNEVETKTFLARFDSDSDIGTEPHKNGTLLAGYESTNGKV
uniref:Sushi domain-containing protein n=1 Tax=Strigamia maritima TaxID=126957 RepID=T1IJ81_STRMM